ncbi:MAG TPA: cell wall hydrolase [Candidatus Binatia bacterium]|nr:cell wall hydrolase [Candidatus Binatia bacterium]
MEAKSIGDTLANLALTAATGGLLFYLGLREPAQAAQREVQTTLEEFTQESPRSKWNGLYTLSRTYDLNHLPNAKATTLERDDDLTLLARVLYGEARGQSREMKTDIAYSILNRTGKHAWWGNTLKQVLLKPWQYSCLNANDPNHKELLAPTGKAWRECVDVAQDVLLHPERDPTQGATHYHTERVKPAWSVGKTPLFKVGNTFFYALKR